MPRLPRFSLCLSLARARVEAGAALSEVLQGHLTLRQDNAMEHHKLRAYVAAGIDKMGVYLPLHKQRSGEKKMHELDLGKTLGANLLGKTVVEFPVLWVCIKGEAGGDFEVVKEGGAVRQQEPQDQQSD